MHPKRIVRVPPLSGDILSFASGDSASDGLYRIVYLFSCFSFSSDDTYQATRDDPDAHDHEDQRARGRDSSFKNVSCVYLFMHREHL